MRWLLIGLLCLPIAAAAQPLGWCGGPVAIPAPCLNCNYDWQGNSAMLPPEPSTGDADLDRARDICKNRLEGFTSDGGVIKPRYEKGYEGCGSVANQIGKVADEKAAAEAAAKKAKEEPARLWLEQKAAEYATAPKK